MTMPQVIGAEPSLSTYEIAKPLHSSRTSTGRGPPARKAPGQTLLSTLHSVLDISTLFVKSAGTGSQQRSRPHHVLQRRSVLRLIHLQLPHQRPKALLLATGASLNAVNSTVCFSRAVAS